MKSEVIMRLVRDMFVALLIFSISFPRSALIAVSRGRTYTFPHLTSALPLSYDDLFRTVNTNNPLFYVQYFSLYVNVHMIIACVSYR